MGTIEGEMPMMLLALTVALLAGPQDDPSVLYREGLYEEIDQGNLEKALDLYGKLLKGNAEPGLKARAFYRRGACLEKTGKKAEAEQVYRDVQERFPEQAEIVKQARGRLAALSGNGRGATSSPEAEIQQLILDLGLRQVKDAGNSPREKAIHRLTLIGESAVPELKRALAHKDKALACGAARVLVELEHPEGTYDVILRSIGDSYDQQSFSRLLSRNEDARKQFCGDSDRVPPMTLSHILNGITPPLKDPRLSKSIEDRVMKVEIPQGEGFYPLANAWWQASEAAQLPAVVRRLLRESEKPQLEKVQLLLSSRPQALKVDVSPEFAAELLQASKSQDIRNFGTWLRVMIGYLPTKDLVRVVFAAWLKGPNTERALMAAEMFEDQQAAAPFPELPDFVCDALLSKDYRDDIKGALVIGLWNWVGVELNQEPRKTKLMEYFLDYLQKIPAKQAEKGDAVEGWGQEFLFKHLPDESPGWEHLFDLVLTRRPHQLGMSSVLSRRMETSDRVRSLYVQAVTRALVHEDRDVREHAVRHLGTNVTPQEQRALAKVLPRISNEILVYVMQKMTAGFSALSVEERKAETPSLAPLFKSENARLREQMVAQFKTFADGSVDGFMKDAIDDVEPGIRRHALEFWIARRSPDGIPILTRALQDPDVTIKRKAITALGRTPSLDSVPPILELLRSSDNEVRSAAQTALKEIQQYYDEQEQWRKWYEDMKKRAPKDK
jgi:tetratricopeptide (TPR) repeat protein